MNDINKEIKRIKYAITLVYTGVFLSAPFVFDCIISCYIACRINDRGYCLWPLPRLVFSLIPRESLIYFYYFLVYVVSPFCFWGSFSFFNVDKRNLANPLLSRLVFIWTVGGVIWAVLFGLSVLLAIPQFIFFVIPK